MPEIKTTFVLGAGRSGTTITTRILEACGARLGDVDPTYAEHRGVKVWLKERLQEAGFDPLGQRPLPPGPIEPPAETLEALADEIATAQVVKDPKLVWIWPTLLRCFPTTRFVLCYRTPQRIGQSAARMPSMPAIDTPEDGEAWARAYQEQCNLLSDAAPDRCSWVVPDQLASGEAFAMRSAAGNSGLVWNDKADRVFRPELWSGG